MTNQVNQAFEKWWHSSKYMQVVFSDNRTKRVALDGYEAATQAHESEINSLKQRVEELEDAKKDLEDEVICKNELISTKRKDVLEITDSFLQRVKELQADNNQLREALETARGYQFDAVNQFHSDFAGYKEDKHKQYDEDLAKTDNALYSTPAQSLAEHDNDVIQMCANEFNVDSNEYKTIQALKG